jgi:biopolymer transport protein ExbD
MFFQKKMEEENQGMREINMTPLIDVSLVLVVMLLLATPLALESSIDLRRSAKTAKQAEEKKNDARVEIHVISDEQVEVNRMPVALARLQPVLKPLLDKSPDRLVVVACNDGVSHGAFVSVLDQAKLCGAGEIAVTEK